jgi:hypothetical protein
MVLTNQRFKIMGFMLEFIDAVGNIEVLIPGNHGYLGNVDSVIWGRYSYTAGPLMQCTFSEHGESPSDSLLLD